MSHWDDGEVRLARGSGGTKHKMLLKDGVYSCSCPAWRFQKIPIEQRTCKHLKRERGVEVERERVEQAEWSERPPKKKAKGRRAGQVEDDEGRVYDFG